MTDENVSSIRTLKGIGEKTEALFNKLNIYDLDDLIAYAPRAYYLYKKPVSSYEEIETGIKQAFFHVCRPKSNGKKGKS